MLYGTYDDYTSSGGTLEEAVFAPLCAEASRLIDRFTFGRAEHHAAACAACRERLAEACCRMVESIHAARSACAVPGAVGVSNDGYSVTFSSGALSERLAAEAQSILAQALGSDPHGLLYRGCF